MISTRNVRTPGGRLAWWPSLVATRAGGAVVLVRLAAGSIFLSEGIQKFRSPDRLGPGRFDRAGIPAPELFAYADAVAEIACGLLLLAGLLVRVGAASMLVNMTGALLITKLPILWGGSGPFPGLDGWWDLAHAARLDWALLLATAYLLVVGGGRYSLDAVLAVGSQESRSGRLGDPANLSGTRGPRPSHP